jgi:hypothetical protein
MLFKIPFILAARIIMGLGVLVLGFHSLVILEVIPYTIVWGSRLNSYEEMIQYEAVSLILITGLIALTWIKTKNKQNAFVGFLLWAFVGLFAFNTVGNLLSKNLFEMIVFTPLTFILALLCARVAMEK